eukprot:jgi/Orpsp1_1/1178517/evm.model.c7180000065647.1
MDRPKLFSEIIFNDFDHDHSGTISVSEFRDLTYSLGYYLNDTELDIAVKRLDKDGKDCISYNE